MTLVNDAKIKGLYAAIDETKKAINAAENREQKPPWVYSYQDEPDHKQELMDLKDLLFEQEADLISLERGDQDEVMLAEQRMELFAESRMMGISQEDMWSNYDHLGNTPYQEQRFQESIERRLRYDDDYYDSYGNCQGCNKVTDEWDYDNFCSECSVDIYAWMAFISYVTPSVMLTVGRWKDQYEWYSYEDYAQMVEEGRINA